MKKSIPKILSLTIVLFAMSCSNFGKSSYISSFEQFVSSVSEKQDTYTDEDWDKAGIRFAQFAETDYQKYSRKLTKEEKQKIGMLKGKYFAIRTKSKIGNFMNNLQDAIDEVSGVVEGFMEEVNAKKSDN